MNQWSNLLKQLAKELGPDAVDKWLRPLRVVKFDAGNIFLDAADSFQINWFKEYVSHLLPHKFLMASGKPIKVHFSIGGQPYHAHAEETEKKEDPFAPNALESHAQFDHFILSDDENLAHEILSELLMGKLPPGSYNPIYIYGPKGSGKSHLLMATARAFREMGKKCCYVRADTFTEHVIRAFRSSSLQEFRSSYRDIEVLIIDDVHLFSRKSATQEELFHTFNRLHTQGLQIILGSNVAPCHLEDIAERLISRFEWGITLALTPPSEIVKKEILGKRADALTLPLSPPLIEFLLQTFKDPHSLIQALEALALRLPQTSAPPDLEIAKHHLKDLVDKASVTRLTPEKILTIVANTFGIKTEDILGKGQTKEHVLPRQIAMYLCRIELRTPFLKLGRFFSRDHSTVMTSVKRVQKGIEKKEEGFLLPLSDIKRLFLK